MTTQLKSIDGEFAVIIDKPTLVALGIDESTRLEVTLEEGNIRISPTSIVHRDRVLASARRMMDLHDETFRKLAE